LKKKNQNKLPDSDKMLSESPSDSFTPLITYFMNYDLVNRITHIHILWLLYI